MKNFLYVFYNKLSKRYEAVQAFPSDEFAIHQCKKNNLPTDEYEICRIGSMNIENGMIETYAPIRLEIADVALPTTQAD